MRMRSRKRGGGGEDSRRSKKSKARSKSSKSSSAKNAKNVKAEEEDLEVENATAGVEDTEDALKEEEVSKEEEAIKDEDVKKEAEDEDTKMAAEGDTEEAKNSAQDETKSGENEGNDEDDKDVEMVEADGDEEDESKDVNVVKIEEEEEKQQQQQQEGEKEETEVLKKASSSKNSKNSKNSTKNSKNTTKSKAAGSKSGDSKNKKKKTTDTDKSDGDEETNWEDLREEDGTYKIGAAVFCPYRKDGSFRPCVIIEKQRNSDGSVKYYVHYIEFNRRMDTWVSSEDVTDHDPSGRTRRQDVVEFVEEEYGGSNGMDPDSIREHEEITKVKNVNRIELGRNIMETWYFSPIPREFFPEGSVDILYISEFTLDMYRHKSELERHYRRCKIRHPPGDEIYRDDENKISMFEVDGAKSKIYSQNLSYIAKFFLDHKTLHWDVDPFLFYVLCEYDEKGYHPVGYFSKEKYSEQGYNLACILTLPAYQRKGYGKFLISFSYELSKKEEKVGSPEKPLSDLGQLSYRSYWCFAVLEALLEMPGDAISVIEITKYTSIKTEDVILALKFLDLIKFVNGRYVLCADEGILREKLKRHPLKGIRVDPERLHWAPLKVDIKRDKWSIKAKRKAEPASFQPL